MSPRPDFAAHRNRLLAALPEGEAVLIFGARPKLRNSHTEYRYRPDSDLYWLTGWDDPDCAVFLRHGDEPFVLFVQPKNPEREIWDGYRPGPVGARKDFGADRALEIGALDAELPRLLHGVSALHVALGHDAERDRLILQSVAAATRAARRNGFDVPSTFHSHHKLLHELRLVKSDAEIAVMREAGRISSLAHVAAMRATKPGSTEHHIEAALMQVFAEHGSTGPGYTPIVAAGDHACTLHYVRNNGPLQAGQLLLVDAGCEVAYYTADITRTWPVSGRYSPAQRDVYDIVLAAQAAAIATCTPAHTFNDVHDVAVRVLVQGMIDLKLLEGEVDGRIEDESYKRFYMHGTSHWLGLDVHDVGAYGARGKSRQLEPNVVLTVEPGLYLGPNDDQVPAALRGIGVRIEDDIRVTAGAPDVLSVGAPKAPAEVEALLASFS